MARKPTYEELEKRVHHLEAEHSRLTKVEAQLKRNLCFTESLLSAIPMPVFFKDTQGLYQGCNPAFTEIMGVTADELCGKTVHELWPSDHADVYHKKDLELIQNPSRQIYEFKVKDKDGTIRPVIYYKNAFFDERGEVAGLVGGFIDITERIQAELEQQAIFTMSLDMLCIADIHTATFLKVNPAFIETLGYSEEELLGRPFLEFIHPEDVAPTQEVIDESLKKGEKVINFKNRYRCRDGSYRWLNWVSHPLPERGVTYAVAHDATDEIRTNAMIRSQRDLLNSLFDNLPLGITVWDADGDLLMSNNGFSELTGYSTDDIASLEDWFNRACPDPEQRTCFQADWSSSLKSPGAMFEFKATCKTGAVKDIELCGTILEDGRSLVALTDITERSRARNEREASHQLLQSVLSAVPDLLIVVDRDYNIHYSNYRGIDRIEPPQGEMARTCYGRFKLLDAPCDDCVAAPVFATGQSVEREVVNPADGRLREMRAFPIRDAKGQVTRVVQYVRDITELRQAQEEIRRRRQFLESVLYHAPDAIITLDALHRVIDWNPGAVKMFGYSPQEAIGMQLDDLVARHEHHAEACVTTRQVLSGQRVEAFETVRYRKDGTPLHVIASGSPIMVDGVLTGVVAVYTDISDRVRTEEALRTSHQRFLTVLDSIDATIYVSDMNTHEILFMNKYMIQSFGRDMTGAPCWKALRQKSGPCPHCTNDRLIDEKGNPTGVFVWQGRSPITGKWYMHHDRAIEWTDGRMVRLQIAIDITDHKKMEDGLRQVQRMEALGTLAGGIAHDFNNLLMGIQGHASLMWMDLEPSHPHSEHIHAIEQCIRSAMSLTKQLLGLARGGKYEVKPVDINELVSATAAMFGRTRKEIPIITRLQLAPLVVEADKRQIEQVLLNIFVNAWQAMPDGGELFLETQLVGLDEPTRRLHEAPPGSYARISITDTGIGMDEDIRQRVFDPFFTTRQKGRGTGLGLASAYGIVKNHGGIITVYSEVGHGTTFHIYLPISDKEAHQEVPSAGKLLRGTETILLVDDEATTIEVGKTMLERLGYRVVVADRGEAALEAMAERGGEIDLVILDLIMPGMDGGKVFDRIRQMRPDMFVLLSSGYALNGQAEGIMERGCNGFIQKPFTVSELSHKVRTILDQVGGP